MTRLRRLAAWLIAGLAPITLALLAFTRHPDALQALGLRPAARPLAVVKADPAVRRVASADTDFGFRLLARLAPDKSHPNVFFSPFSLSQALAMTWNGAGGATQTDIGATLGLTGLTPASVNAANGLLLPSLEDPDPQVKLSVANALWLQTGKKFRPAFTQDAKCFYRADTTTLNLRGPQGAPTINGWVSKHTRGKIDQIVTLSDLSSATAVLTDAVYFHGEWTKPFDKAETHNAPFRLGNGRRKMVALMSQDGELSYLETPQFQAVRLPYGEDRLAMYVFLPKSKTGLDAFLGTVSPVQWRKWIARMQTTELTLYLPRFHAADAWNLNAPLSQMGMASSFGNRADFSPMGLSGSYISKVVHKATLDVDEKGTVATAATGEMETSSETPMVLPPVMRVDHPFLCAIRDDATGTLLFLGAIRDPQKAP